RQKFRVSPHERHFCNSTSSVGWPASDSSFSRRPAMIPYPFCEAPRIEFCERGSCRYEFDLVPSYRDRHVEPTAIRRRALIEGRPVETASCSASHRQCLIWIAWNVSQKIEQVLRLSTHGLVVKPIGEGIVGWQTLARLQVPEELGPMPRKYIQR